MARTKKELAADVRYLNKRLWSLRGQLYAANREKNRYERKVQELSAPQDEPERPPSLDQQKGPLEYLSRDDWMRQAENQLRALEEGRCGTATACAVLRTQIAKIAAFAAPQEEQGKK